MKKFLIVFIFLTIPSFAAEESGWFVRPAISVGYNNTQGSYYSLGLNLATWLSEQWLAGVGAYYSVGSPAVSTREIGAGPFLTFYQPINEFVTFHVREEINYVDQREPLSEDDTRYDTHRGVLSATSIGAYFKLVEHLGISGGYRFVVGLSNDELDDGRSGVYLGVALSL